MLCGLHVCYRLPIDTGKEHGYGTLCKPEVITVLVSAPCPVSYQVLLYQPVGLLL